MCTQLRETLKQTSPRADHNLMNITKPMRDRKDYKYPVDCLRQRLFFSVEKRVIVYTYVVMLLETQLSVCSPLDANESEAHSAPFHAQWACVISFHQWWLWTQQRRVAPSSPPSSTSTTSLLAALNPVPHLTYIWPGAEVQWDNHRFGLCPHSLFCLTLFPSLSSHVSPENQKRASSIW